MTHVSEHVAELLARLDDADPSEQSPTFARISDVCRAYIRCARQVGMPDREIVASILDATIGSKILARQASAESQLVLFGRSGPAWRDDDVELQR